MGSAGERRPATLEERIFRLELEAGYFRKDVERQFVDLREHGDKNFDQLRSDIRRFSAPAGAVQDFRDPQQWLFVIIGIIGGFVILFVALWLATQGFAR